MITGGAGFIGSHLAESWLKDGHSVSIEYHDGQVYFSSFGVDKAGVFSYDPKTETVQQVISLSGNLAYIHFFD